MPIDKILVDSPVKLEGLRPDDFTIKMDFDVAKFLSEYEWDTNSKRQLQAEIKSRKIIVVYPICLEANFCFEEMFKNFKAYMRTYLMQSAKNVLEYKKYFKDVKGLPQVTSLYKGIIVDTNVHENYLIMFEIAEDILQ